MATSLNNSSLGRLAQLDRYLEGFPRYLSGQRGLSENTERIYLADLQSFRKYLAYEKIGLTAPSDAEIENDLVFEGTPGGGTGGLNLFGDAN